MRLAHALLLALTVASPASAMAQAAAPVQRAPAAATAANFPPGAEQREQRLLPQLSPAMRAWILTESRQISPDIDVDSARAAVSARFPGLGATDIDSLALLLMMQVNRSAEADLRGTLAEMKATNARKQAQRDAVKAQRARAADLRRQLSGSNDMGEPDPMRLQAERRQKAFETMSNLMKKSTDTMSAIIDNLK